MLIQDYYIMNNIVYYGCFDNEDISGYGVTSGTEIDLSCKLLPKDNKAYYLIDNNAATSQQIQFISECMNIIKKATKDTSKEAKLDFTETEERLGVKLPEEIKALYSALNNSSLMDNHFVEGKERFLPLDKLYLDETNLVFYKIKRTPVAISLKNRRLMKYYKKEWYCDEGSESFFCYVIDRVVVHAISSMPYIVKAKVSGELKSMISPEKKLVEIFDEQLSILKQYDNYGNIILYNENGVLAWFRQNGFKADITIGGDKDIINHIINKSACSDIEWK